MPATSTGAVSHSKPLDAYRTQALPGADERSRRALGNHPLLPNGNLAGYLTQPPLQLTNLRSLTRFGTPHCGTSSSMTLWPGFGAWGGAWR